MLVVMQTLAADIAIIMRKPHHAPGCLCSPLIMGLICSIRTMGQLLDATAEQVIANALQQKSMKSSMPSKSLLHLMLEAQDPETCDSKQQQ